MSKLVRDFTNAFVEQLTRKGYFKLIGGSFPEVCDTEAETLEPPVQLDGYTREKIRLRVLNDATAITEHPELQNLRRITDNINNPFSSLQNIYDEIAQLNEQIQYNYGNPPFVTEDLGDMDKLLAKFPLSQAKSYVEDLFEQTLRFYTHKEAYVLRPDGIKKGEKRPGVVVLHQHNAEYDVGKSEPVGLAGKKEHAMAVELVKKGNIVIVADQLGFESRRHPICQPLSSVKVMDDNGQVVKGADGKDVEKHNVLTKGTGLCWERWRAGGLTGLGKTLIRLYVSDAMRDVDYLVKQDDVDSTRLAVYGHSLGAWVATHLAMVDQRIKLAVANCGFPLSKSINAKPLEYHCEPHILHNIARFGDHWAVFYARAKALRLHMNFGGVDALNCDGHEVGKIAQKILEKITGSKVTSYVDRTSAHANTPDMIKRTLETFDELETMNMRRDKKPYKEPWPFVRAEIKP